MNKKKRAELIAKVLWEHFPDPAIPLRHSSPFELLIAVLLSAQCTDERVNKVTEELFKVASTPEQMASLPEEELFHLIRSCGLAPTKSKACRSLSQILIDRYHSEVPADFEALESLPGVGHKTASVVMAQAFNIPAFPVDTHIFRAAHRWGLSTGKTVEKVEADLKRLFPKEKWILLHLQIILFCRAFCPAKGHRPEHCPICSRI